MMSLRRIFGLMLLFLFFEAVVAVVTTFVWPDASVFLACLGMTGLAVGVCIVFLLIARLTTRPRTAQPPPAAKQLVPAPSKASLANNGFVQDFSSLVSEANRRLTTAVPGELQRRVATVATIPLYLAIGAEDSGKTSAIMNSGLEPVLLAGEEAREGRILPTRLCNLWFAENSVIADISGRILMQEAEHWEQALRLLGGQQPRSRWKQIFFKPQAAPALRGVVLFCDTNTFVRTNEPARITALARLLNERLQTATTVFRNEFPVYVVFSKSDSVQDFADFFAHVNDAEERRVLGVTLPMLKGGSESAAVHAENEEKRLTGYFNRLCMSLADKRLLLLAREEDSRRRARAYEFPRELRKVRSDIVHFLLDLSRPTSLQQRFRLRGYYFSGQRRVSRSRTAVDQTGTDFAVAPSRMDATGFLGSKSQLLASASLPAVRGAVADATIPRWLFLNDVFRKILLKDHALHTAPPEDTRDRARRNLLFGGIGAVLLLFSLLLANSWRQNRRLLEDVGSAVEAMPRSTISTPTPDNLARLDSLRASLVQLQQYRAQGAPQSYRWGLYAGNDVQVAAKRLYWAAFRHIFMDPLLAAYTARFASLKPNNAVDDDVYTLLKSYRMITSGGCKPDEKLLNASLMPVWSSAVHASPDLLPLAEKQINFYTSELKTQNPYRDEVAEDGTALTQARTYLSSLNGPEKVFRALLEQVNHDNAGDSLGGYAVNYNQVLSGPSTVEGAYTINGWKAMIDRIHSHKATSGGDTCVLGEGAGFSGLAINATMERDVERLYVQSFIQQWASFMAAHHVLSFNGLPDGSTKLHTLADNNRSPLLALVYMASHNTDVPAATSADPKVVQTLEQLTNNARQGIGSVLDRLGRKKQTPGQPSVIAKDLTTVNSADVIAEFQPVHAMVDPAAPDKWLNSKNQEYMQALEVLSEAIAAVPARPDPKNPIDEQAIESANKAAQNAQTALHTLTGLFPNTRAGVDVDLRALLAEPIRYSDDLLRHLPPPPPQPQVYVPPASAAAPATPIPAAAPAGPPPPPPPDLTIPIKAQVNRAAENLCASLDHIRTKYPFDPTATDEAYLEDLNEVFAPITGTLAQFLHNPDVSKVFVQQGKGWVANPAFPATFSQPFLITLNDVSLFSDELYAGGGNNPGFDYTVTLDGTGKVPFELDADGHAIQYNPHKPSVPVRLVWPPVTSVPTKLVLKTGLTLPAQSSGPWSFFRLLQAADDQNGNLYTFRTIQFAGSKHVPIQDGKGNPVTIQIRFDSPVGNIFARGFFSKMHCEGWTVR
jgi:type VI secretion system protein ImpL